MASGIIVWPNTTAYLKSSGDGGIQWSSDGENWTIILMFPVTIENINPNNGIATIHIVGNLTITNSNMYFIIASSNITFGSKELNSDGTKPTIVIQGLESYGGLIQNGTSDNNGYDNIVVCNLNVDAFDGEYPSILEPGSGWVGCSYFGKGASNNSILNCWSNGDVPTNGGGIIGSYAMTGGENSTIRGCSNVGSILGESAGGILGAYSGSGDGTMVIEDCFSNGEIWGSGGGILGAYGGGTIAITRCFSSGSIYENAGGIVGFINSESTYSITVTGCYSIGMVMTPSGDPSTTGGGIFGNGHNYQSSLSNCYCLSGYVYAGGMDLSGLIHCYEPNGEWNTSDAKTKLLGAPISDNVGTIWVEIGVDDPFELNHFGTTPYSQLVVDESNALVKSISITMGSDQMSSPGILDGTYELINTSSVITDNFTIIVNNGVLLSSETLEAGDYILTIRQINTTHYSITQVYVNVPSDGIINQSTLRSFLLGAEVGGTIIVSQIRLTEPLTSQMPVKQLTTNQITAMTLDAPS